MLRMLLSLRGLPIASLATQPGLMRAPGIGRDDIARHDVEHGPLIRRAEPDEDEPLSRSRDARSLGRCSSLEVPAGIGRLGLDGDVDARLGMMSEDVRTRRVPDEHARRPPPLRELGGDVELSRRSRLNRGRPHREPRAKAFSAVM